VLDQVGRDEVFVAPQPAVHEEGIPAVHRHHQEIRDFAAFAERLETKGAFTIDGKRVPAGNYALLFHPNTLENAGMSLEIRNIAGEEFLQPGNVMTPAPDGETMLRVPVSFETVPGTAPALAIELLPGKDATSLTVRYGDRRLVKELRN